MIYFLPYSYMISQFYAFVNFLRTALSLISRMGPQYHSLRCASARVRGKLIGRIYHIVLFIINYLAVF
jgi:hypothetical protein